MHGLPYRVRRCIACNMLFLSTVTYMEQMKQICIHSIEAYSATAHHTQHMQHTKQTVWEETRFVLYAAYYVVAYYDRVSFNAAATTAGMCISTGMQHVHFKHSVV